LLILFRLNYSDNVNGINEVSIQGKFLRANLNTQLLLVIVNDTFAKDSFKISFGLILCITT